MKAGTETQHDERITRAWNEVRKSRDFINWRRFKHKIKKLNPDVKQRNWEEPMLMRNKKKETKSKRSHNKTVMLRLTVCSYYSTRHVQRMLLRIGSIWMKWTKDARGSVIWAVSHSKGCFGAALVTKYFFFFLTKNHCDPIYSPQKRA